MADHNTIFLIGMMGSGKSTIGSALAEMLNRPFLDTDIEIERLEGRSVTKIFEESGEVYFREKEQEWIMHMPNQSAVVACGGGLPCFYDNIELLKSKGMVVYLEGKQEVLFERIKNTSQRPKLRTLLDFEHLLKQRKSYYEKAHVKIDANQSLRNVCAELYALIQLDQ